MEREAPLILLPVELRRNARSSSYDLRCRDDDIVTNLPLQERLQQDFGIILPELSTEGENWTPTDYFSAVRSAIASKPRWSIDEDGMQLGFFSFAKLLMLRDLNPENWSSGTLECNPFIAGLLKTGFETEEPLFPKETRLDETLQVADIIQVVDADSSQTKVIEEVRSGRNLVVQGPPGTGKSQTITNMIASAVHDGKTVLFVAEKMAALQVVHNRLKKTGLDCVGLELHSRQANKKEVLSALSRTLMDGSAISNTHADGRTLQTVRDSLNELSDILHRKLKNREDTPHEILSWLVHYNGENTPPPRLNSEALLALSSDKIRTLQNLITSYAEQLGPYKGREAHSLYGVENQYLEPVDLQRIQLKITEMANQTHQLETDAQSPLMPHEQRTPLVRQ